MSDNIMRMTTMMYLAPAILHVERFLKKELYDGTLRDANEPLYYILKAAHLLQTSGALTHDGEEVFASTDLIKYYMITGREMAESKNPHKKNWNYDILRSGLAQNMVFNSNTLLNFLRVFTPPNVKSIVDLGCGEGALLTQIGTLLFPDSKYYAVDKNIRSVKRYIRSLGLGDRYKTVEADLNKHITVGDDNADLVILSEVMHLSNENWMHRVMRNALRISNKHAQILIREVKPEPAFDWRMDVYTDGGYSISLSDMLYWLDSEFPDHFEKEIRRIESGSHWHLLLTRK